MTQRRDGVWVGFDLGGTKMLASVFDSSFEVIGRDRKSTLNSVSPKKNLKRIAKTIDGALAEAGLDRTAIRGIGIGCPGAVDMTTGLVHEAINLGWRDVQVGDWLTEKMDCPVLVVNDVDAGVYGEYRFGAARGSRCVVGIFPGTGIGGGCVYEGRILRGNGITCMEIGHFPINPGAPARGNGRCHTLEHVSSRLAIAAAAAQAAYRGHAPHLAEHVGTEVATIRSGALSAAIDSGDTVIEEIVREAAEWIGGGSRRIGPPAGSRHDRAGRWAGRGDARPVPRRGLGQLPQEPARVVPRLLPGGHCRTGRQRQCAGCRRMGRNRNRQQHDAGRLIRLRPANGFVSSTPPLTGY